MSDSDRATRPEKTLARLISGGVLFVAQLIAGIFQMIFGILSALA